MLWFPVGYTVGYLVLLLLVAAPLRRSGAYTLPDFAEMRLESRTVRRVTRPCSSCSSAGSTCCRSSRARASRCARSPARPTWVGAVVVAVVVASRVVAGRHALDHVRAGVPVLAQARARSRSPRCSSSPPGTATARRRLRRPATGARRCRATAAASTRSYTTYSIVLATFLGTMGLPHVLVRFYTNPDGRRRAPHDARRPRAALRLLPVPADVRGARPRSTRPSSLAPGQADTVVLVLPGAVVRRLARRRRCPRSWRRAPSRRSCRPRAGCRCRSPACCRRTCSRARGPARRRRAPVPPSARSSRSSCRCLLALVAGRLTSPQTVTLAFAVAASTFCPLLVLGHLVAAADASPAPLAGAGRGRQHRARRSVVAVLAFGPFAGIVGALLGQPAAWTVPLAFLAAIVVSLRGGDRVPRTPTARMTRLHAPEELELRRHAARADTRSHRRTPSVDADRSARRADRSAQRAGRRRALSARRRPTRRDGSRCRSARRTARPTLAPAG